MKRIFFILIFITAVTIAKAQDWANVKKYEVANAAIQARATNEKRVIYMGDSITDFWISNDSVFFASQPYLDRGISGQTTGQMLLRFRQYMINLKTGVVKIFMVKAPFKKEIAGLL